VNVQALPALTGLRLRHRPPATLLLFACEILALQLSLLAGYLLRLALLNWRPQEFQSQHYKGLALGLLVIPFVYLLLGLLPGHGMSPVERLEKRLQATFLVFALLLAWDYLVLEHQWSRGILLATALFAFLLPPLLDEIARNLLARAGWLGAPTLILGAGRTGEHVLRHLQLNPALGLLPLALLDDNPALYGTRLHGIPVAGPLDLANTYVPVARTAIVAMPTLSRERRAALIEQLRFSQVIVLPDLEGMQSLWITARDLGGVLGLEVRRNLLSRPARLLKRAMDLLITTPLLLVAAPLIALSALLIKLSSHGPAFFVQLREGLHGRPFPMLKLRTMHPDSEDLLRLHLALHAEERENWSRFYKLRHDPRVIPFIGAFLRRFSLDELPQLLHVFRGTMSLVGPRPFPAYHLEAFPPAFRGLRSSVPPGLTGLWQVSARSDGDLRVQQALDSYYIRNWSPWLDLHILIRTLRVVLAGRGAY